METMIVSASEETVPSPILTLQRKIGGRSAIAGDATVPPVKGTDLQTKVGDIARAHIATGRVRAPEIVGTGGVTRTEDTAIARGQETAHTTVGAPARRLRRDGETPTMTLRKR